MTPIDYNNPNDMWRHNGYDPYKGMSDEERMKAGCLQLLGIVGGIIVALLICALFGSCTTTKYVPVIEHRTDTVRVNHTERDSIYIHDSTYIKEKGDTVLIEKLHTRWRDRVVHDTVYKSRVDSVPVPYEVEKQVSAPLTWWQRARLHLANIELCLLVIVAVLLVVRKCLKKVNPML